MSITNGTLRSPEARLHVQHLPMLPALANNQRHFHRNNLLTASAFSVYSVYNMPSSKGEPTDPELREKIKEEVKAEEKGTAHFSHATYMLW